MTNLYYGITKQLLERISSVMVDAEAIAHLVAYVKDAVQGGDIITELGRREREKRRGVLEHL